MEYPNMQPLGPVSVGVDHQLSREGAVKYQAEVHSATDVPEETLQRSKVGLPGIMHVETDLLNSVGEVRPGEGEVLQSAGQTPVGCRVSHRITQISR